MSTLIYQEISIYPHVIDWELNKMTLFRNVLVCAGLFFAMFLAGFIVNICLHCGTPSEPPSRLRPRHIQLKNRSPIHDSLGIFMGIIPL